ncbi:hypothetical protein C8Q80DRAFT_64871 [Daedaleopsis nitida]|nr:hypothetical protein C8Q80DRAFT_64871 [Daedaleopsis nitida]
MMLPPQQPMAVDPLGYSGRPHDSASPGSSAQGGQTGSISDSRRSSMVQDGSHGPKRKKEQLTDPTGFSKKNKKDKVKDEGSTHYRDGSHSEDLQYASASSTGHPQHGSIVKDAKQFFVKGSGQPYRFFVQLQIISPKRGSIVAAIKVGVRAEWTELSLMRDMQKHGGVIESDIAIADFVILAHPKTTLFAEYFRQSCNMGKTPVKPQWVLKCDEKDRVVELDAYTYDGYKLEKKRGRPGSAGQQYVVKQVQSESEEEVGPEDQGAEEEENEETRPPKRPKKNAKEIKSEKKHSKTDKRASNVEKKGNEKTVRERATTSAVKAKDTVKIKAQRSLSPKGHREPSPLPPTDVVEFKSGKNLYTTAEEDYCDKYIPILLERDPAMTTSLIAEKLHAKMPHHPKGSWMSHLTQPTRRDKLERYRRRAEVQSRKARSASTWDPTKVLAEFFAAGRADSLQDSDVWKSLAEEHPQMRAEAWESLWQTEYENVQQEIARLGGPEASENAQAEPQ